jgi:hypothetical protein
MFETSFAGMGVKTLFSAGRRPDAYWPYVRSDTGTACPPESKLDRCVPGEAQEHWNSAGTTEATDGWACEKRGRGEQGGVLD